MCNDIHIAIYDVNIIAIEKVNPDNIDIAVGILFLCAL